MKKTLEEVIKKLFFIPITSSRNISHVGDCVKQLTKEEREVLETATAKDFSDIRLDDAWLLDQNRQMRREEEIEKLASKNKGLLKLAHEIRSQIKSI